MMWHLGILIVLACGLACVQSLAIPGPVEDKCLAESNTTRFELYDKVNEAQQDGNAVNVEMNFKCYVHCVAAEMDLLDEDNHLNIEKFQDMEKLGEHNYKLINECHGVNSGVADKCDYAFELLLCYSKDYSITEYINIAPGKA